MELLSRLRCHAFRSRGRVIIMSSIDSSVPALTTKNFRQAGMVRGFRARRRFRGSAVVEFAAFLPLLVLLLLLCVDLGRFVHSYIAITNACRAGAAYGSVHPVNPATKATWDANIRQAIDNELASNSWYVPGDLTLQTPQIVDEGLLGFRRVEVELSYPFTPVITWLLPGYNSAHSMGRKVVMRQVRS